MKSGKPIWLLDIDGVLNALAWDESHDVWGNDNYMRENCNGYYLQVSLSLREVINSLHLTGQVEVRWLTTWEQDAVDVFAPQFGFDKFAVQTEEIKPHRKFSEYFWWKQDRADAAIAEGRPVIWTDDDMPKVRSGQISLGDGILKIRPETEVGLTPEHIKRIVEFVYDHRAPAATN